MGNTRIRIYGKDGELSMEYPKYQADWTVGNQMFHVRTDNLTEFTEMIESMQDIIPNTEAFPNDHGSKATPQSQVKQVPMCGVHHIAMIMKPAGISKKTGKGYPAFWSCGERMEDGSFCTYRPPKEEV